MAAEKHSHWRICLFPMGAAKAKTDILCVNTMELSSINYLPQTSNQRAYCARLHVSVVLELIEIWDLILIDSQIVIPKVILIQTVTHGCPLESFGHDKSNLREHHSWSKKEVIAISLGKN